MRDCVSSAMPLPHDRAWQLPWLRLHLFMRDALAVRWGREEWLVVMPALVLCVEWRRALIQAGWFN
jgi:hypothetical protein